MQSIDDLNGRLIDAKKAANAEKSAFDRNIAPVRFRITEIDHRISEIDEELSKDR